MEHILHEERLLNRTEVQQYFGLSQRFLEVSAGRGDGPPIIRIGRSVRYRVADVRAWIDARKVPAAEESAVESRG